MALFSRNLNMIGKFVDVIRYLFFFLDMIQYLYIFKKDMRRVNLMQYFFLPIYHIIYFTGVWTFIFLEEKIYIQSFYGLGF